MSVAPEPIPAYSWDYAKVGDEAETISVLVRSADVEKYYEVMGGDRSSLSSPVAAERMMSVPIVLVRIFAPLRRHELIERQGAKYPAHPTPAIKWHCQVLVPIRVGDTIVSVTRVRDKYVKRDRHFLHWEVEARRLDENNTKVAVFNYVNLWDAGKKEDRLR